MNSFAADRAEKKGEAGLVLESVEDADDSALSSRRA